MSDISMKKVVFTAMSKRNFYARDIVCQFVFGFDCVPVNPFRAFSYFLSDLVDRDKIRNANNVMLQRSDELWIFGDISNGVQFEIELANSKNIPIRYFTCGDALSKIHEIKNSELKIELED